MGGDSLLLSSICIILLAVVAGQDSEKNSTPVPKPIISSLHVFTDIKYTYANTLVSSKILNPAKVAQEVTFRVVLPEEAFITGLIMTIKGKSYEAYIKGKEEAKKEYDAAVSAGQSAAHVFQDSRFSKDFTVSVNVEPEEKVNFNLTYEELLSRKNKTYKNEINVNPHQIVRDLQVTVIIEDILNVINVFVPEFQMNNEVDINESENSSIKKTVIAPNKVKVEWNPSTDEQIKLNKDGLNGKMIVKYDVDASKNSQQILVDQDGYFVHILRNDDLPVLNKHVVFVLDVSGSMAGRKIEQLKDAMKKILVDLSESDYFSIVLFSVEVVAWGPKEGANLESLNSYGDLEPANIIAKDDYVIPASKANVESALNFIKSISDYGGTNILGGLRNGLKLAKLGQSINKDPSKPVESMIIFLTDGQPNAEESNTEKIIEKVESQNNGVTIFSLGFGFDADMKFLKKLSLINRGFARTIYEDSDASLQLQNFYKEVASPVLSDIKFEYLPDQIENVTSDGFKNLFRGSDLTVLGKVKPNGKVSGVLTATSNTGTQKFPIPIDQIVRIEPENKNVTTGYLQKMWAYKTIKSLLDQNTISKNDSIENKAKELALKYSFVTPLTSLVVVKPNDSATVKDEDEGNGRPFGPFSGFGGGGYPPPMAPMAAFGGAGAPGSFAVPVSAAGPFYQSAMAGPPPPPSLTTGFQPYRGRPGFNYQSIMSVEETATLPTDDSAPDYFTTTPAYHETISYQNVTWLNQTVSDEGYLIPPDSLGSDVITLNGNNSTSIFCTDGKPCVHFISCTLKEFAEDISKFIPFQCHIPSKYLGVCCPL